MSEQYKHHCISIGEVPQHTLSWTYNRQVQSKLGVGQKFNFRGEVCFVVAIFPYGYKDSFEYRIAPERERVMVETDNNYRYKYRFERFPEEDLMGEIVPIRVGDDWEDDTEEFIPFACDTSGSAHH